MKFWKWGLWKNASNINKRRSKVHCVTFLLLLLLFSFPTFSFIFFKIKTCIAPWAQGLITIHAVILCKSMLNVCMNTGYKHRSRLECPQLSGGSRQGEHSNTVTVKQYDWPQRDLTLNLCRFTRNKHKMPMLYRNIAQNRETVYHRPFWQFWPFRPQKLAVCTRGQRSGVSRRRG